MSIEDWSFINKPLNHREIFRYGAIVPLSEFTLLYIKSNSKYRQIVIFKVNDYLCMNVECQSVEKNLNYATKMENQESKNIY